MATWSNAWSVKQENLVVDETSRSQFSTSNGQKTPLPKHVERKAGKTGRSQFSASNGQKTPLPKHMECLAGKSGRSQFGTSNGQKIPLPKHVVEPLKLCEKPDHDPEMRESTHLRDFSEID